MIIQTYERGYKVTSHILTNELGDIYICRDIATGLEYTVLRVRDRVIVPGLMVYLNTNLQKETFSDYKEHFIFEDDLCIVLKYYRGISLLEKLNSEHCSLIERIKIGKMILGRIVFLDMPLYFLKNCLTGERIIVKPNLEVSFNYLPGDISALTTVNEQDILKAFTIIFGMLFANELSKESAPPINQFFSALQKEQYFNSTGLYKQYTKMCREVMLIPEEELKKPKSKWFLFWERVKRQFGVLKRLLAVALILLALIYLACTIKNSVNPKITRVNHFEFIGTRLVEENQ